MQKLILIFTLLIVFNVNAFEIKDSECNSPVKLKKQLEIIKLKVQEQARNLTAKEMEEQLKNQTTFANWLTTVAPYMIKEEVRLSNFYNQCWVFYKDFLKVLEPQKKTEYQSAAEDWKACLKSRDRKLNPQVQMVFNCLGKFN